MKRALFALFILLLAATAPIAVAREPFVVNSAWLAEHLNDKDLVLIHIGTRAEFDAAHIPGGVFLDYPTSISTPRVQGSLALQIPPVEQLKETFESLGVSNASRIVVYFGKDWVTPSGRVLLTLEYLGLGDRSSLLDGGQPVWVAENHPVTTDVKQPVRGSITPNLHPDTVADLEWVSAHLQDLAVTIVDARTSDFYGGAPGGFSRGGHLPGAVSIPFTSLVESETSDKLKDPAALAEIFRAAGVKPGSQIVTYCHVGQQASFVYFVARMLGYNARMYDGSMNEWSQRTDLPLESSKPAAAPAPKPQ